MDRPEPGLVKWSSNPSYDNFIHINLQHRVVQVYEPTGHARAGKFDYQKLTRHDDFPPLTTYDWSPTNPGLLAVGTGSGIVNLLRIDDGSNAYVELGLKMSRTCQAVAFNTTGLLAVGLDRVRMDQCLHIWDVSRLSSIDKNTKGFPSDATNIAEPKTRLEPSVSVSSIKFFEDSPQTLVVGIKAQGLRIHDLRDPSSIVTFQTKCNNNLTIDYADQNYFASSALDHPGVMIWDRRATSRPVASHAYMQAIEEDELPWGGALRLDRVIETDSDPFLAEGKYSLVRSLRYCRDHRGLLAVLSRTGQLKVLNTNKEAPSSGSSNPELLQVQKSYEMDVSYVETSRKNDRIVAFDWVTLSSPVLRPRLLVLRANGNFEILEQPSQTSDHVYKLVPWKAPHRGLEEGAPYHSMMQFEPSQAPDMLGPLLVEEALSEVPLFGPESANVRADTEALLKANNMTSVVIEDIGATTRPLPEAFHKASTVAAKIRALRAFVRDEFQAPKGIKPRVGDTKIVESETSEMSLASDSLGSCREIHDALLASLAEAEGLPREAQNVLDHNMLLRAKEKYLFDAVANRDIVADDPWVKYIWDWVATAEDNADDGGMILSNIDLSYVGVHSIWTNNLGRDPSTRLPPGATPPDRTTWERTIASFCKKNHLPKFNGADTKWPAHRQLCLEICGWGDSEKHDPKGRNRKADPEYPTTIHTMAAARALFTGDHKEAIQILKKASTAHPELLFVSLALQLMGSGDSTPAKNKEQLDFDEAVASKTDPYLRAISSLIATGDWTAIASQLSLPLSDRVYVAIRNFDDDQLTQWLNEQITLAIADGDIEGIVLTGITEPMVDIFARYIQKFHDVQTATLVLSICAPRYIDDIRCRVWRNTYRAHLQRHKLFFQRTKFDVESTKRSKRDGIPKLKPPSRQIALRCVFCDAETSLANNANQPPHLGGASSAQAASALESRNPLLATSINAGVSCPNCGRHLPRCVVCLEIVGVPRSDKPEEKSESKMAGQFPTFCLRCEHVLHLDHARQWFARHVECPVPECRCRCNFRANPELSYR
ncbi:SEH-associated protein 4 [Fusarium oxysporum f. sp. cubense]|uniref:SEH-associated protein 4 n=1 Tax=Fusarium oxysporum f. sp. cubense TaxID=61366 RepID=A0A559LVJ4_FUSOC|nr:SEH-associated protein 4 [Fusarium oxysporum f. sp. cubense]